MALCVYFSFVCVSVPKTKTTSKKGLHQKAVNPPIRTWLIDQGLLVFSQIAQTNLYCVQSGKRTDNDLDEEANQAIKAHERFRLPHNTLRQNQFFVVFLITVVLDFCCRTQAFSSCSQWELLFTVVRVLLTAEYRLSGEWASPAVVHRLSCPSARGIFPDHRLNPCPLHQQADSDPLYYQRSLRTSFQCSRLGLEI